jgi:hypothetical protein
MAGQQAGTLTEGGVMAKVTREIRDEYGLAADLVPTAILKSIPQEELFDRLAYCRELTRKSQTAIDPVARRGYAHLARAMISARPRAEIQREHTERIAKAAGLPPGSRQAQAIKGEALDFLDANPVAPRRRDHVNVAKAAEKAGPDQVVIYDAGGKVVGLCDPAEIVPLVGMSAITANSPAAEPAAKPTGEPADEPAAVGKARRPVQPIRRVPGRRSAQR